MILNLGRHAAKRYLHAAINEQHGVCIKPGLEFAAFLVAKSNLAIGQVHRVYLTIPQDANAFALAGGELKIQSLRKASESGETWLVSGDVTWDTAESLLLVTSYLKDPNSHTGDRSKRRGLRMPVSIAATLNHNLGECTDVSRNGIGLVLRNTDAKVGDKLAFSLLLTSGAEPTGVITISNVFYRPDSKTLVGGTIRWSNGTSRFHSDLLPFSTIELDETLFSKVRNSTNS
jgi:hypothetical protein